MLRKRSSEVLILVTLVSTQTGCQALGESGARSSRKNERAEVFESEMLSGTFAASAMLLHAVGELHYGVHVVDSRSPAIVMSMAGGYRQVLREAFDRLESGERDSARAVLEQIESTLGKSSVLRDAFSGSVAEANRSWLERAEQSLAVAEALLERHLDLDRYRAATIDAPLAARIAPLAPKDFDAIMPDALQQLARATVHGTGVPQRGSRLIGDQAIAAVRERGAFGGAVIASVFAQYAAVEALGVQGMVPNTVLWEARRKREEHLGSLVEMFRSSEALSESDMVRVFGEGEHFDAVDKLASAYAEAAIPSFTQTSPWYQHDVVRAEVERRLRTQALHRDRQCSKAYLRVPFVFHKSSGDTSSSSRTDIPCARDAQPTTTYEAVVAKSEDEFRDKAELKAVLQGLCKAQHARQEQLWQSNSSASRQDIQDRFGAGRALWIRWEEGACDAKLEFAEDTEKCSETPVVLRYGITQRHLSNPLVAAELLPQQGEGDVARYPTIETIKEASHLELFGQYPIDLVFRGRRDSLPGSF